MVGENRPDSHLDQPVVHLNQPVVTLFGTVGAGVEVVGPRVAAALGLPYHPQAFSSETIAGGPDAKAQEQAVLAKVVEVLAAHAAPEHSEEAATEQLRGDLVEGNSRLVHQYADEGGVIVGRNAALILAEQPRTLHVLLTGHEVARFARAAADTGLPLEQATLRAQREDQVRADMSLVLYGWDPRKPERYDLVIDTSRVPLTGVVDAIVAALRAVAA